MNSLYLDPKFGEERRRELLYDGQIFLLSPTPASLELCAFAARLSREAFPGLDPVRAHESMPVEKYAAILSELKPKFIHHPESKRLLKELLAQTGCDLQKTYFDVPRLRTAAPWDYLRFGIAYAFQPHRDTWYSAPANQINWWMPVFPMESGNAMAFHPRYWHTPLRNNSHIYDYQQWNAAGRQAAAGQVKADTRQQPYPQEAVEMEPQLRLVIPVGGLIIFSGAQLHSTVPNRTGITRFSIDFRTVNGDDVRDGRGAHNIDSACTGTALGDYLRGADLERLPPEWIARYEGPFPKGSPSTSPAAVAAGSASSPPPTTTLPLPSTLSAGERA